MNDFQELFESETGSKFKLILKDKDENLGGPFAIARGNMNLDDEPHAGDNAWIYHMRVVDVSVEGGNEEETKVIRAIQFDPLHLGNINRPNPGLEITITFRRDEVDDDYNVDLTEFLNQELAVPAAVDNWNHDNREKIVDWLPDDNRRRYLGTGEFEGRNVNLIVPATRYIILNYPWTDNGLERLGGENFPFTIIYESLTDGGGRKKRKRKRKKRTFRKRKKKKKKS
jgi:hypothetical protein